MQINITLPPENKIKAEESLPKPQLRTTSKRNSPNRLVLLLFSY